MKIRNGLVSNSSSSSFMINAFMYSGMISTPIIVGWIAYQKSEKVKNIFKLIKLNCIIGFQKIKQIC